ncbi:MAG TPA: N-6 DNA methylase, partial [Enteractinococcus sp.]
EKKIRRYLVDNNYVDTVIQLPPDLFFGTTIGTCIIVLKKAKIDNDVLFIDASAKFRRDGNKNILLDEHRDEIVTLFSNREDVKYQAQRVSNKDVAENDYNLTVSAYVELEDTREKIDIVELNAEIAEVVTNQMTLREEVEAIVAELEADRAEVGVANE